ncbi:unnamed protein product [Durusdinium trenchii]|uniref:Uncharacterized protein n=1 Tax=Durusdinium trenchii TaxID=1381693 RepID=A0ABP0HNV5_9DINO
MARYISSNAYLSVAVAWCGLFRFIARVCAYFFGSKSTLWTKCARQVAGKTADFSLQELTSSDLPPPLLLEIGNGPTVSLVSLESKQVLCSAHSPLEALRALNTAGTSKQAPPTNGHVKLPKGNLAVLVGCDGDVWEAAVAASTLREKVKELSGMDALPPVVLDRGAQAVSLVKLGKDVAHGEVICSAPAIADALAVLAVP